MTRLLRLLARSYPAAWRDRYGVEFQALLDETKPGWRDVLDVFNGGLQMRLRRAHPALTMTVFGVVGAFGAGAAAFGTADRFASTGTMTVRSGEGVMPRLARSAFNQDALTSIIQRRDLYRTERGQSSAEGAVNRMRGDIGLQLISPSIVQVSFTSGDARQAQEVASDLVRELVQANLAERSGATVQVIDPPGEALVSVSPRRVAAASLGGLGGGALIGALIGLFRRRPGIRTGSLP